MNITSFRKEFRFRLLSDGKYYTTYVFIPSVSENQIGYVTRQDGSYVCWVNHVGSTRFEWTAYALNKGFVSETLFTDCEILHK